MTPIEVRSYGSSGPVVVLLHGGPGAPGGLAPLARDLAGKFRVLEPLQRRHGAVALSVAQHVADLAQVAPEGAHVVGHSWGAMLGLSYAARHPARLASLVLVGCGTYDAATRAAYQRALDARLGEGERTKLADLQGQLACARDRVTRDALFGRLGRVFGAAYALDAISADDESLAADELGYAETWADVLRLQRDGIEPAAFAAIRAPVLMLHGDDDPHPGPAIRDLLARYVADLSYVGLPRCGHDPWNERHAREPFLRALEGWIQRRTAGAT